MCALKFPMSQILSSLSLKFSSRSKMWRTLVTGATLFSARTETVTKPYFFSLTVGISYL